MQTKFSSQSKATSTTILISLLAISRAWERLHAFPRLALVARFPALNTGFMFSRAWHLLHVLPRLTWLPCFPTHNTGQLCFPALKGPGKRGHIVADTLLPTQMFPRLAARAKFVADTKNVSDFVQKHFVSATNVFQFAQPKKHHGQQCVRNNVSSFTRALTRDPCFPVLDRGSISSRV